MRGLARRLHQALAGFACAAALAAPPQGEFLVPPKALVLDGVPPIPAAVAARAAPYTEFNPSTLVDWHPQRREILVRRRHGDIAQLHRVAEPGAPPEPVTTHAEPVAGGRYAPGTGDWVVYSSGRGGDEAWRLHRLELATGAAQPLSPADLRAGAPVFDPKGERLLYTTQGLDRSDPARESRTTLHLVDPKAPESGRVLAVLPGVGWCAFRFSPDGRRLAFVERKSAREAHLWIMEVATGKRRRLTTPGKDGPVYYADPHFAPDGKSLYAISDRGSEYRRVAWIDVASGRETALAANLAHDVEDLALSAKARRLAFVTNEAGAHVLRFLDLATRKETPRPALVSGVISGLQWRADGSEIAFTHASSRSPGDVFSYDLTAHRVTRWTNGNSPALNAAAFPEPRVIRWRSFDGREITGLYYHPPSRFEGVRPVVIDVHGGPEAQARAGFLGRNNYLVNELGIALIRPNVRGSPGFGKTFLALDDGRLREDAVKDLGALLDWVRAQPGLDAERVLVTGGSDGGDLALAASMHYPERIAGAVSAFGMSISPLAHAGNFAKPLLIAHGRNDPRVPWAESEGIVAELKKRGTPVWSLLAADEGHGFARKANADFLFHATLEFVRRTLFASEKPPA